MHKHRAVMPMPALRGPRCRPPGYLEIVEAAHLPHSREVLSSSFTERKRSLRQLTDGERDRIRAVEEAFLRTPAQAYPSLSNAARLWVFTKPCRRHNFVPRQSRRNLYGTRRTRPRSCVSRDAMDKVISAPSRFGRTSYSCNEIISLRD